MALITPNDCVNDPNSAAVLDVAIYFCRPNDSSLSLKRPISCRQNGYLGKNLSPKHLSPKRLVAQMTVDRLLTTHPSDCLLDINLLSQWTKQYSSAT